MSKKQSEFDRYERQKKLEKEAEVEKRREMGLKKKSSRPKAGFKGKMKDIEFDDEYM